MVGLAVLELWAIRQDQRERDSEQANLRCEERQSFQAIADSLSNSITQAGEQYKSTITHVDGVLTTTQDVASLSRRSLENITGGDSYGYVLPSAAITRFPAQPFSMYVKNSGSHILTQVSVSVSKVKEDGTYDGGMMTPIDIGTLAGHGVSILPQYIMVPVPDSAGIDHHLIIVKAQNGSISEDIWFKRSKDGKYWDYKVEVDKLTFGENAEEHRTLLKSIPWTGPDVEQSNSKQR